MEKNHLLEETKETGFGQNPGSEKDVGGKMNKI